MINRSSQGVTVSAEAEDVLNTLYSIQKLSYHLAQRQSTREKHKILSVASVSFFSTHLIPDIFSSLMNQNKQIRYRLIDLPPNQLIPVALRNGFQICVHMDELEWPRTWTSIQVGVMKWVLCCRKGHPLLKNPTQAQALKYPFLYPVYWSQEGLRYGDDSCPIPIAKRIRGTETATAASAAAVVERTDEIGFLPQILAEHSPNIEIIEMKNWKPIVKPVYLTVKSQVTSQKTFEQIQAVCREKLNF